MSLKVILCSLLVCFFSPLFACDTTLRYIGGVDLDMEGEIAKKVLKQAGCKLEKIHPDSYLSLQRRMKMLKNGDIDLIIAVSNTPERAEYALFSLPIARERVVLWARSDDEVNYQGDNLTSLLEQGFTILAPEDGWYGPEYQQLRAQGHAQIKLYNNIETAIELFHKGRADLILGSEHFTQFFSEDIKDKTVLLPITLHRDYLALMFSKKTVSEEKVQLINNVIAMQLDSLDREQ